MRRAPDIDFALPPRTPGTTLQQWLYDEIRAAVLGGRLRAGQRLLASRDLARQQGVSRGTVVAVYEQLTAEGYLAGTPGRGTAVSDSLPAVLRPAGRPAAPNGEVPGRLATAGQRLAATPFPLAEPLAGHRPDSNCSTGTVSAATAWVAPSSRPTSIARQPDGRFNMMLRLRQK